MGLSQNDKQEIIDAVIKSRPSKLTGTALALIGGVIGGSISLVAEQILGDTKDVLGWNMSLIEAERGITRSTETGRYIFAGGSSMTPYNLLLNTLASELDDVQYGGYGYAAPGGSTINLQGVNSRSYPMALAFSQADVYAHMRDAGELEDTSIIMNTGIPECAFTIGNYITFAELAEAAQQAAWGNREKVVIGMPNSNSGSHITADNIVQYGLDPNGIEIKDGYVDTGVLLDAYERGEVDVAIFVQYPAAIDGELRSGMKTSIEKDFNIIAMDTMSYNFAFRDLSHGYNLLQLTLPRNAQSPATTNRSRTLPANEGGTDPALANLKTSKPMLCTEILLAGQKITSISDIIERGNATNLHGSIQQKIKPEDLQFPDMPEFRVLDRSTKPIEISYGIEASSLNGTTQHAQYPGLPDHDGLLQDWMRALRPDEFAPEEFKIDYALNENLSAQPAFG